MCGVGCGETKFPLLAGNLASPTGEVSKKWPKRKSTVPQIPLKFHAKRGTSGKARQARKMPIFLIFIKIYLSLVYKKENKFPVLSLIFISVLSRPSCNKIKIYLGARGIGEFASNASSLSAYTVW